MAGTRRSAAGLVAAATAFLLPVAYVAPVGAPLWSPKAAVLLIAGAIGVPALVALTRTELRAVAVAALAFAACAALSTAVSPQPAVALFGIYNWGTGFVFLACCVGLWALGAVVPPSERALVTLGLLAGLGISGVVALLQTFDVVDVPSLRAADRVFGLAGNPVHLGALAAGAVAIGAERIRSRAASWLALAAVGAFVAQLSGTRFSLAMVLIVAIVGALRVPLRRGLALLLAVGLGLGGGALLADARDLASATTRSTDSTGATVISGSTSQVRLEVWRSSRHAIARRPLLGHGPGRYRAATSRDRSLREAQLEGGDTLYYDAHNILVEHLVTTGVLGAAALSAWIVLAFRRARAELAWFAAVLALMSLVQPMYVGVTPLLFLALGVAGSTVGPRTLGRGSVAVGVVGAVAALMLVVGDNRLNHGFTDVELASARRADQLLPWTWSEPAALRAFIHGSRAIAGNRDDEIARAIEWRREALRRDQTDPRTARVLADLERREGLDTAAERHYRLTLRLNPWSTAALTGLARLAEARGDDAAAAGFARRALEVQPDPDMEAMLRRLGDR